MIEKRRQRRLLAIKKGDVGEVATLLKHEAAAGYVVDPWFGHFGPGLVPVEILPEDREREARQLVIGGLMDRRVDNGPVDAVGELEVDKAAKVGRSESPWRIHRGHRLCGREVLTVDMGDGRGALHIPEQCRP